MESGLIIGVHPVTFAHENVILLQSTICALITEYFNDNSSVNIGG